MLITPKNLDTGAVVTLKLLGGDEVIARLEQPYDKGQETLRLIKPQVVMMAQQGFGLVPFILTSEEQTVEIAADFVMVVSKTMKQVADKYLEQTTGLAGMG